MNCKLVSSLTALAIVAVPALSQANPDNLSFTNVGMGNDYTLNYGGTSENVFVGQLDFKTGSGSSMTSYCVDLDHMISPGQSYNVNAQQTSLLPTSNVYREAGNVLNAGLSSVTDADHAAAMQIAIWDTVYGNKFSLSGVSNNVLEDVNKYLQMGASYNGDKDAIYFQETCNNGQSQIMSTPEPASMALLGIGLAGIVARRRKKVAA